MSEQKSAAKESASHLAAEELAGKLGVNIAPCSPAGLTAMSDQEIEDELGYLEEFDRAWLEDENYLFYLSPTATRLGQLQHERLRRHLSQVAPVRATGAVLNIIDGAGAPAASSSTRLVYFTAPDGTAIDRGGNSEHFSYLPPELFSVRQTQKDGSHLVAIELG